MKKRGTIKFWLITFFGIYGVLVTGFILFDLVFVDNADSASLEGSRQSVAGALEADENGYSVFFRSSTTPEQQLEVLGRYPEVTFIESSVIPEIAQVSIIGDVKSVASRMKNEKAIILVRGRDGVDVCH